MKRFATFSRGGLPWLVFFLPALALMAGCVRGSASDEAVGEAAPPPVPVEAAKARRTTLRPELILVGTIVAIPEQTAMVSPQLGGWVEKLAVVAGQKVKAGDLLVQLDSRTAHTDVLRAKAIVAEKESALKRLRRGYLPQEIETARQDRDRAKAAVDGLRPELAALDDLLKRREISSVAYETKAKNLKAAEAALASADAHLKLLEEGTATELIDEAKSLLDVAKADLEHANLTFQWCSITSPIDGVVVQLQAHQGQFFDRAVPLATIIDLSDVFVQLRIPSRAFAQVRHGAKVSVQVDSLPGRSFAGTVARISGEADPLTGNVVVFASVKNDDGLLRPGLGCQAQVLLPDVPEALAIPVAALADKSGTPVVTLIRDGKAYETEVQTGTETLEFVQIVKGLSDGDLVSTAGGYGLPEGCPVRSRRRSGQSIAAKRIIPQRLVAWLPPGPAGLAALCHAWRQPARAGQLAVLAPRFHRIKRIVASGETANTLLAAQPRAERWA